MTEKTKVCSRHFRSSDLKKSLNGRVYVKEIVVPSRFKFCPESQRKRKAPAVRFPLQCSSFIDSRNESETVQKAYVDELEQDAEDAMIEKLEGHLKCILLSYMFERGITIDLIIGSSRADF